MIKDPPIHERPIVVCLCGSTKFAQNFQYENFRLTMEGKIVLSIGCDTKTDAGLNITDEEKAKLDALHFKKLELADVALILNVGGYVGESTAREIAHAHAVGCVVEFLEPV